MVARIPKHKMKRAQLKIQQMAFMLMAVILFFVLVGLFVIGVKSAGVKQLATDLEEENAKLLVSKLANSPEFSCGDAFSYGVSNCIDADKVMVLKDKQEYTGFWDVADIEIRKVYPAKDTEIECDFENYDDCNLIDIYSKKVNSGTYQSNFVSLCRKQVLEGEIYNKCELAKLLVSYEVKE